jgi:hypothetical protein
MGSITVRDERHELIKNNIMKLQKDDPETLRCLGPSIVIRLSHQAQLPDEVEP